eukprot:3607320-Prymnesium_polylepis.1
MCPAIDRWARATLIAATPHERHLHTHARPPHTRRSPARPTRAAPPYPFRPVGIQARTRSRSFLTPRTSHPRPNLKHTRPLPSCLRRGPDPDPFRVAHAPRPVAVAPPRRRQVRRHPAYHRLRLQRRHRLPPHDGRLPHVSRS